MPPSHPPPPPAAAPAFVPQPACWICGGEVLRPVQGARFELSEYTRQDPELAAYSGSRLQLVRCDRCGFAQPEALPALADYFGRMYDQRWSAEWMQADAASPYKDLIFRTLLAGLERRLGPGRRTLLDIGAHLGRLLSLAAARGWQAEGVELNPSTAAFAARATGLPVHREDARALSARGRRFHAVTLVDVLEHIPQPLQALAEARAVLEPGGWIALKVPHGPAQIVKERLRARLRPGYRPSVADNLVHVSHFGARSLRLALRQAGFIRASVGIAAPELIPAPGGAARAANAGRLAVWRAARLLPGAVHTPLALHLLAYAQAPA